MIDTLLGLIEIVEVPNDIRQPKIGTHRVELVKINDHDIVGVRTYHTHDEILVAAPNGRSRAAGDDEYRVYCLETFQGSGRTDPFPKRYIADCDNVDLGDLSSRSERVLPPSTLQRVRDSMQGLRDSDRLARYDARCSANIRLEQYLKTLAYLNQSQKPL